MCGIAGSLGDEDRERARRRGARMARALRHRGPDGTGSWEAPDAPLWLGHRRLSILDLSVAGDQPLHSADGRFVITYNGEVYNYRELREECERLGSRFRSTSDTEVIAECHRHFGSRACQRFTGMWAYALLDRERRELHLCRDRLGIKPLYWAVHQGVLYFASEPKGLLAAVPDLAEVDEVSVRLFEEHGSLERGDWTFFRRIKRFPAAHRALIDIGGRQLQPRPERYWSPPERSRPMAMAEAAEELCRLLTRSVQLHLRSDVPVGSCLSGGLDSSAIVCLAAREPDRTGPLHTFTTHYPDHPELDESAWAERVVEHAGAIATWVEPDPSLASEGLDHVLWAQDEPFGSTSILAQYAVFRRIGESGLKVVMDGQGADEQLAGYHGLLPAWIADLARRGRLIRLMTETLAVRRRHPEVALRPGREIGRAIRRWARRRVGTPASPDRRRPRDGETDELEDRLRQLHRQRPGFEGALVDMTCDGNLRALLRYEDRNSMASSVEARVPFLEHGLVEFLLAMPAELKIRRGVTKAVLREALAGVVPEPVRNRIDKLGFPAPEREWLRASHGLEVSGPGQPAWRRLIVSRWRALSERGGLASPPAPAGSG